MAFLPAADFMQGPELAGPILLFDGVCNLCNAAVRFVISHDPAGKVRFASLQSNAGKELLARYASQLDPSVLTAAEGDAPPTVLLIESGRIYDRSTAALRLLTHLREPWPVLSICHMLPKPIRDPLYDFIARRRYRWFGRTDACRLPTAEEADRFLG